MIHFIRKNCQEDSCEIEVAKFKSVEDCINAINKNNFNVPDIIVSDTMGVLDFEFEHSIVLIVAEQYVNAMTDVLARGLNTINKSDDFIIQTIAKIHGDKIKHFINNSVPSFTVKDVECRINQCRDKCVEAIRNGIRVENKVVANFLSLKCDLGIVEKQIANN